MKALGIIRKLDELGRVVVPKEVRDAQGWEPRQPLEMFMEEDSLIIRPYGREQEKQQALEDLAYMQAFLPKEAQEAVKRVMNYVE